MSSAKALRIGELSRRTGCSVDTIRYYERIGLLPRPERRGSYRIYDDASVSALAFIRRARDLGFTLEAIGTLLRLAATPSTACADARALAASHLREVRQRISDLQSMERTLAQAVQHCDTALPGCAVIETLAGTAP